MSWKPNLADIKSLIGIAGLVMLASYASKLYQLVDQGFVAQISADALRAHVLISYVPLILNYIAIGVGYALIVLLNKADNQEDKAKLFSGGLVTMAVISAMLCGSVLALSSKLLSLMNVASVPGAHEYLAIMTCASGVLTLTTAAKYAWVALRRPIYIVIADGIGCLVNAAGDYLVLRFIPDDAGRMAGIALVTLAVQLLILVFYCITHKGLIRLDRSAPAHFWTRARGFIGANVTNVLLEVSNPLLLTALLETVTAGSLTASFNVGFYLFSFLAVPSFAINAVGTGWIAEAWKGASRSELTQRLASLTCTAAVMILVPSTLLLLAMPILLSSVYHLSNPTDVYLPMAMVATLLPMALSIPAWCIINAGEKPRLLVYAQTICQFAIGIPCFYLALRSGSVGNAAVFGVIAPSFLYFVIGAWFALRVFNNHVMKESL